MTEIPAPLRQTNEHATARRGPSIQLRLLALVMAAALPALLFSVFQAGTASRVERGNAEQRALQLARRISTRVDDHVNTVDALLVALSRSVRPERAAQARNDALLVSVSRDLGVRFLNFTVADSNGHVVGLSKAGGSGSRDLTVSDRKYFREALRSGGLGIGEPMIGKMSHSYAIALGRAILGPTGKPIGVVAASTLLEQLRAVLIPSDLPERAVVTLLDSTGQVLARTSEGEEWVGHEVGRIATDLQRVGGREGVSEVVGQDGVARLTGHASAARVPWTVYVGIPSQVALARVRAQERQARWLFVGSLTVSLLLAWLIARGIVGPVRMLTADADAFASGDLAHRTTVQADGELGTLATTFNRMADALQRRGAQLSDSEIRYRILFETMPLPMWVYDSTSLRFLAVNRAALERYGYSLAEFLGMTVLEIRPEEDRPSLVGTVGLGRPLSARGDLWRHRTKSGELLEVEISSNKLLYGDVEARLVVASDVTVRRRTESALLASQEQLRQSQKMEAIGSLAGGIAHDFNNLLTAILGYCDLALEEMDARSTPRGDVEEIRRAAQRAAELTHQLLAFSRRQVLKTRVFSLDSAVGPSEKILRRLISENIALELSLAPDTPLVRADPTQLEQVVLNLAVNARDAMPRGGRLRVTTGGTVLREPLTAVGTTLPPGPYSTLEVSDTGTGISPEVLERLFEPFFTTKERGQGTGLGLATVYGIVQQSGGAITVSTELGVGTTFTLHFPVAAPGDEPVEAVPGPPDVSARGEGTILLAEDDDAVRAIAREALERAGYLVLAAPDGPGALALADAFAGSIDLLLTDVIMPGMNGLELAEALAERRPGLCVLYASGYTDNVLLDHGVLAPGVSLLDKPFTPAMLTARVAAMLGARPVAPA
jgi:PAS domain S-box-containing protein